MSSWVVTNTVRREDGRLDVTYSVASGVRFTATIIPGTDAARAIAITGDHLAQQYESQGFI